VLINQALHQLDIWQWTTGFMPKSVRAVSSLGKYHDIEVEDDVTALVENETLTFFRLTQSEREFNATFTGGFGEPECWKIDIPAKSDNAGHMIIIQKWVDSIVNGSPLLAPGEEGVKALEISNAIYLSSLFNKTVELPVNPDLYYEKIASSRLNVLTKLVQ